MFQQPTKIDLSLETPNVRDALSKLFPPFAQCDSIETIKNLWEELRDSFNQYLDAQDTPNRRLDFALAGIRTAINQLGICSTFQTIKEGVEIALVAGFPETLRTALVFYGKQELIDKMPATLQDVRLVTEEELKCSVGKNREDEIRLFNSSANPIEPLWTKVGTILSQDSPLKSSLFVDTVCINTTEGVKVLIKNGRLRDSFKKKFPQLQEILMKRYGAPAFSEDQLNLANQTPTGETEMIFEIPKDKKGFIRTPGYTKITAIDFLDQNGNKIIANESQETLIEHCVFGGARIMSPIPESCSTFRVKITEDLSLAEFKKEETEILNLLFNNRADPLVVLPQKLQLLLQSNHLQADLDSVRSLAYLLAQELNGYCSLPEVQKIYHQFPDRQPQIALDLGLVDCTHAATLLSSPLGQAGFNNLITKGRIIHREDSRFLEDPEHLENLVFLPSTKSASSGETIFYSLDLQHSQGFLMQIDTDKDFVRLLRETLLFVSNEDEPKKQGIVDGLRERLRVKKELKWLFGSNTHYRLHNSEWRTYLKLLDIEKKAILENGDSFDEVPVTFQRIVKAKLQSKEDLLLRCQAKAFSTVVDLWQHYKESKPELADKFFSLLFETELVDGVEKHIVKRLLEGRTLEEISEHQKGRQLIENRVALPSSVRSLAKSLLGRVETARRYSSEQQAQHLIKQYCDVPWEIVKDEVDTFLTVVERLKDYYGKINSKIFSNNLVDLAFFVDMAKRSNRDFDWPEDVTKRIKKLLSDGVVEQYFINRLGFENPPEVIKLVMRAVGRNEIDKNNKKDLLYTLYTSPLWAQSGDLTDCYDDDQSRLSVKQTIQKIINVITNEGIETDFPTPSPSDPTALVYAATIESSMPLYWFLCNIKDSEGIIKEAWEELVPEDDLSFADQLVGLVEGDRGDQSARLTFFVGAPELSNSAPFLKELFELATDKDMGILAPNSAQLLLDFKEAYPSQYAQIIETLNKDPLRLQSVLYSTIQSFCAENNEVIYREIIRSKNIKAMTTEGVSYEDGIGFLDPQLPDRSPTRTLREIKWRLENKDNTASLDNQPTTITTFEDFEDWVDSFSGESSWNEVLQSIAIDPQYISILATQLEESFKASTQLSNMRAGKTVGEGNRAGVREVPPEMVELRNVHWPITVKRGDGKFVIHTRAPDDSPSRLKSKTQYQPPHTIDLNLSLAEVCIINLAFKINTEDEKVESLMIGVKRLGHNVKLNYNEIAGNTDDERVALTIKFRDCYYEYKFSDFTSKNRRKEVFAEIAETMLCGLRLMEFEYKYIGTVPLMYAQR